MNAKLTGIVAALAIGVGGAHAGTITLNGFFNDPFNAALVASDLGTALFGSDADVANNVALYSFSVPVAGGVTFDSNGFTAGGAEPYFTLFEGSGNTATYLASNFFEVDIDFSLSRLLSAGDYMIALGVWQNMSIAENLGAGMLADGFVGLGDPARLGILPGSPNQGFYELVVTTPDPATVPVAATMLLLGAGALGLTLTRIRARRRLPVAA